MREQERADEGTGAGQLPGAGGTSRRTFVLTHAASIAAMGIPSHRYPKS